MKPIRLHPVSVLVGAALVGLSLVLSGSAQSPGVTHHPRTEVFGQIPAEWWTYVEVYNPQKPSYVVPSDRWFVVTASSDAAPLADGNLTGSMLIPTRLNQVYASEHVGLAARCAFPPGTVLTPNNNSVQLWGYLEPVH